VFALDVLVVSDVQVLLEKADGPPLSPADSEQLMFVPHEGVNILMRRKFPLRQTRYAYGQGPRVVRVTSC
jgi:hypothetical protein